MNLAFEHSFSVPDSKLAQLKGWLASSANKDGNGGAAAQDVRQEQVKARALQALHAQLLIDKEEDKKKVGPCRFFSVCLLSMRDHLLIRPSLTLKPPLLSVREGMGQAHQGGRRG